jgi:hypothetical protein
MRRVVMVGAGLALLVGLAGPALAQVPATLVLRSGDRVNGELVDMGADFTMTVDGRERRFALNDVVVIDFVGGGQGLPDTELSRVQAGRATVFMRGGGMFYGRLADISERRPLKFTFDTDNGERIVYSSDIGRVYFARPPGYETTQPGRPAGGNRPSSGGGQPASGGGQPASGMAVPANRQWTPTGLTVRQGQYVTFQASGEIQLSDNRDDVASPAGSRLGRYSRRAPLPGSLAGALIGRIGNATVFGIGDQDHPLAMPASGLLYLGINDDECGDNRGEYRVQVSLRGPRDR